MIFQIFANTFLLNSLMVLKKPNALFLVFQNFYSMQSNIKVITLFEAFWSGKNKNSQSFSLLIKS